MIQTYVLQLNVTNSYIYISLPTDYEARSEGKINGWLGSTSGRVSAPGVYAAQIIHQTRAGVLARPTSMFASCSPPAPAVSVPLWTMDRSSPILVCPGRAQVVGSEGGEARGGELESGGLRMRLRNRSCTRLCLCMSRSSSRSLATSTLSASSWNHFN